MNPQNVDHSLAQGPSRRQHFFPLLGLALLFLVGFATVTLVEAAHKLEIQGLRFMASVDPLKAFCLIAAGVLVAARQRQSAAERTPVCHEQRGEQP